MTLRSNARVLTTTLLAAIGIVPACGGESTRTEDHPGNPSGGDDGTGGTSPGGVTSSGGVTSNGGFANGGSVPTAPLGGSGAGVANTYPCVDPMDVIAGSSGFVRCASGAIHRPSIEGCPIAVPRSVTFPDGPNADCTSDLDCEELPYGYCLESTSAVGPITVCAYGCATDADCDAGYICECGDPVGRCVVASCTSDADCSPGYNCQTHDNLPGCSGHAYACQQASDRCVADADCPMFQVCSAGTEGHESRSCMAYICQPGRPFVVHRALRTAPTVARSDWLGAAPELDVSALSPSLRQAAGTFYAECAALEHASIASFSRFTLGLLAVGAPAELVRESTRATSDEIEHARTMYALASEFLGRAVGPGALAVQGALEDTLGLEELALATFVEGCVGETLGAFEARECAAHALDPALRAALERIADDETRHAALAYRFVAWALERSGPRLCERLRSALETARSSVHSELPLGPTDGALTAYGILPPAHRREARRSAFDDVVAPCVAALLERSATKAARQAFASA